MSLENILAQHPHSKPFWEAAERAELVLPTCTACDRAHWYPRPFCPFCGGVDLQWKRASGRGRIHSASFMRRAAQPYIVVTVALEEGPILLSNLVDAPLDQPAIDSAVTVVFRTLEDGRAIPMFKPV